MPAAAPLPQGRCLARLKQIGERIRDHRRQLGLTATATAEAAGISRVTLHRIEKGTASVTLGALMNVLDALDLSLSELDRQEPLSIPVAIRLEAYPQLRSLAWHLQGATELRPQEAAGLYARNQRHLDHQQIEPRERQLIHALNLAFGGSLAPGNSLAF